MSPSFHIGDFSLSLEYALTKANLSYFQPSLLSHSKELFRNINKQVKKFKGEFQLEGLDLAYQKKGEEFSLELVKTRPVIFVSFHMGPVGTLLSYILNKGVDLKLLLDRFNFDKWVDHSVYLEYRKRNEFNFNFEVLNAEDNQSGIRIANALKEGTSLLLYIDGNTGIGGITRKDLKLSSVDFLGRKIFARKGVAYFSRLFNAPIIPVASFYEKSDEGVNYFLEFSEPIFPDHSLSKEQFVKKTTQKLYTILEEYVVKYPDQWEGWLYFHNFINKNQLTEEKIIVELNDECLPLRFNEKRFHFIFREGKYFLLDLTNYQHHSIAEDVYRFLAALQTPQVIAKNISSYSIIQLLKKGILTKK